MNGSEMLTAAHADARRRPARSSSPRPRRGARAGRPARRPRAWRDPAPRLELVLAVGDDDVAFAHALRDDRLVAFDAADLDRLRLRDLVRTDNVRERAVRAALNDRRRHDERALQHVDLHARLHEGLRPERLVRVREARLEANRRRLRVDLVVDEQKHTCRQLVRSPSRAKASTPTLPFVSAFCTRGRSSCGTVKSTAIGSIWVMTTMPVVSV